MNDKETIHSRVLQKIKDDKVQMKPKIHFVLQTILFAGAILLAFGLTLYAASFILFILRNNGILFLSTFGFPGIGAAFLSLPWLLMGIVAVLIVILELLGRHFSFVYRRPLIYSMFGIILLVLAGSVAVAFTSIHQRALQFTREHHVPLGSPLYERYSRGESPFHQGSIGTITDINDEGFLLLNVKGETITISTSTETRFPRDESLLVGDRVMILGKREENVISAIGIRKIYPEQDGVRAFDFRKMPRGPGAPI